MSEFRHLRLVIAVADSGSFSGAAIRLNVEVSAVSRAIRHLEDVLGTILFDRLPRGVRPTQAGEVYIASAREIIDRIGRAERDTRSAGRNATSLTLGFVGSFSIERVVGLLRAFAAISPRIDVRTVEDGNDELAIGVRSGRFDIAIAGTDPPGYPRLKPIDGLSSLSLWLEPLRVAIPSGLDLASGTWSVLADQRLLCRPQDDWRRFVMHVERLGGPTLTFSEQQVSQEALVRLVATGLGWFILPGSIAPDSIDGVSIVPITSEGAVLQVEALWRSQNGNPALTSLVALCHQLYDPTVNSLAAPS